MKEAGGIRAPISEGAFSREDIVFDLVGMRKGTATLHRSDDEITPSESIGMTLSDLVGAGSPPPPRGMRGARTV
jgi:ornithine cyclodeaminase/alanine dehydrogenase-like protein (mu-crystallin family)